MCRHTQWPPVERPILPAPVTNTSNSEEWLTQSSCPFVGQHVLLKDTDADGGLWEHAVITAYSPPTDDDAALWKARFHYRQESESENGNGSGMTVKLPPIPSTYDVAVWDEVDVEEEELVFVSK